jgi:hypothetical protein
MRRLILVLGILLPTVLALAQAPDTLWKRTYFNNSSYYQARKIIESYDSNLVVVGSMRNSPIWKIFLMKLNMNGDTIWTRSYNDPLEKTGYTIKETPDFGFIIAGYADSGGTRDSNACLIKTDSLGNLVWRRYYGGANSHLARSITFAPDGGYILAGYTDVVSRGEDIYVVKTDSLGIIEWSQNYGGQYDDRPWEIINTSDGGYALAGWSNNAAGLSQGYILKMDSIGGQEWSNMFGDSARNEEARSIVELPDGYIVGGDSCPSNLYGAIFKYGLNGERLWGHEFNRDYFVNSLFVTNSGTIVTCGFTYNGQSPFIAQFDTTGTLIWLKGFPTISGRCRSVIQTSGGYYLMAGSSFSGYQEKILLFEFEPEDGQDIEPTIPVSQDIGLFSAFPNPFNAQTTIRYTLPAPSNISIDIFDIMGRKIETLISEKQQAGEHSIVWNADGKPSGIYFYRLKVGDVSKTEKCILLK